MEFSSICLSKFLVGTFEYCQKLVNKQFIHKIVNESKQISLNGTQSLVGPACNCDICHSYNPGEGLTSMYGKWVRAAHKDWFKSSKILKYGYQN